MRILGIESSCDETAAAVVTDDGRVLSDVVHSQVSLHAEHGGVVPELASRDHLRNAGPVVREALLRANVTLASLDAIAVTHRPGLVGALLVGVQLAKGLAWAADKPLIGVDHLMGHILSIFLVRGDPEARSPVPEFPFVALLVSGGHTALYRVDAPRADAITELGATRDDAAGEAFDKVAKLLGFGYPGGPVVDLLSPHGDPHKIRFTMSKMKGNTLDFSFSGLKTAVLRWVESKDMTDEIAARRALLREHPEPSVEQWLAVTPQPTLDLLASFQQTVVDELLRRAIAAADQVEGVGSLIVSGGVACNSGLRASVNGHAVGVPVYFPSRALSTDNAVMIAAAAFPKFRRGEFADLTAAAEPSLELA
jgi:N6-L-threonylcarbamoyladenine synthase